MPNTYTLETRTCECGCGEKFRTLPNSPSRFASITHDPKRFHWQRGYADIKDAPRVHYADGPAADEKEDDG